MTLAQRIRVVIGRIAIWFGRAAMFGLVAFLACSLFLLAFPYTVMQGVMTRLSGGDRVVNLLLINPGTVDVAASTRNPAPAIVSATCVVSLSQGPVEVRMVARPIVEGRAPVGSISVYRPDGSVAFSKAEGELAVDPTGFMLAPGDYRTDLSKVVDEALQPLALAENRVLVVIRRHLTGSDSAVNLATYFQDDRCQPVGRLRLPVKRL